MMDELFGRFPGHQAIIADAAALMAEMGFEPGHVAAEFRRRLAAPAPRREAVESRIVRACPKCGGTVYLRKLCPRVSPRWRTQLACENAACNWHGLSELLLPDLLATGAAGIKQHVQEG